MEDEEETLNCTELLLGYCSHILEELFCSDDDDSIIIISFIFIGIYIRSILVLYLLLHVNKEIFMHIK